MVLGGEKIQILHGGDWDIYVPLKFPQQSNDALLIQWGNPSVQSEKYEIKNKLEK